MAPGLMPSTVIAGMPTLTAACCASLINSGAKRRYSHRLHTTCWLQVSLGVTPRAAIPLAAASSQCCIGSGGPPGHAAVVACPSAGTHTEVCSGGDTTGQAAQRTPCCSAGCAVCPEYIRPPIGRSLLKHDAKCMRSGLCRLDDPTCRASARVKPIFECPSRRLGTAIVLMKVSVPIGSADHPAVGWPSSSLTGR